MSKTTIRRVLLVASLLVAPSVFADLMMVAWQSFADGSCRFYSIAFPESGPCRSAAYDVYCDPNSATCEALTAPPPDIPRCDAGPREIVYPE